MKNEDLSSLASFFSRNKITLNAAKTAYVIFKARNNSIEHYPNPTYLGTQVERVGTCYKISWNDFGF
jgi:hypothetical protein